MAHELSNMFCSSAQTAVLETLAAQEAGVHIRLLGTLTQRPIRSVELALANLVSTQLVVRRKSNNRILYVLNRGHELFPLLTRVMAAATAHRIQTRSVILNQQANKFLPFLCSTNLMVETAKESRFGAR